MKITLDGNTIKNRTILFEELRKQLNSNEFHANNLDALNDVLSYINEDIFVSLINKEQLIENLGEYGNILIKLLTNIQNVKIN